MGKYDTTRYNHNLNRATFDLEGEPAACPYCKAVVADDD